MSILSVLHIPYPVAATHLPALTPMPVRPYRVGMVTAQSHVGEHLKVV